MRARARRRRRRRWRTPPPAPAPPAPRSRRSDASFRSLRPVCAVFMIVPSPRSSRSTSASSKPFVVATNASTRGLPSSAVPEVTSQQVDATVPRPDAPAELVELRDPEAVGVEHDHDGRVRHVDADLDDGGGHEHVEVAVAEAAHDRLLLGRRQAPVQQADAQPGERPGAEALDGLLGRGHLELVALLDQRASPRTPGGRRPRRRGRRPRPAPPGPGRRPNGW